MENQPGSAQPQDEATGGQSSGETQSRSGQDLMDELARLGSKFVEVVDVAWNSEQRRRAEDDLRKGIETLATSLEDGIKKFGESKQARELLDTAEDVAEKMRTSKVANELADTLARGLRTLSEQMDRLAKDIKAKSEAETQANVTPPPTEPADTPQDIPINRE